VTVWNPLSAASQLLVLTAVSCLHGVTLHGSPVVGAVGSVRTFDIAMVDFGPNSCIKIDFGDNTANEVYGPNRSVTIRFLVLVFYISLSQHRRNILAL